MRAFFEASGTPSPIAELTAPYRAAARSELDELRQSRSRWASMRRVAAAACLLATLSVILVFFASLDPVQAVDRNKELHYEDLFRITPADDAELLKFGFRWIRFCLFGEPTLTVRDDAKPAETG